MAEIVCNYKITNEARLDGLLNRTSDLQTVWEYIWLSYKAREAITDTEIDIFANEQVLANFQLLCLQHSSNGTFNVEHREMLYNLVHFFVLEDNICVTDTPVVFNANAQAFVPAPAEVMEIDRGIIVDRLVDII